MVFKLIAQPTYDHLYLLFANHLISTCIICNLNDYVSAYGMYKRLRVCMIMSTYKQTFVILTTALFLSKSQFFSRTFFGARKLQHRHAVTQATPMIS